MAASAVRRPAAAHLFYQVARLGFLALSACGETTTTRDVVAADSSADSAAGEPGEAQQNAGVGGSKSVEDTGTDATARDIKALTNNVLWSRVEADEDPFDDAPATVVCPEDSFGSEPFGGLLTFYVDSALPPETLLPLLPKLDRNAPPAVKR